MREIKTSGLWTSGNIKICLLAACFLSQHRKEQGSQDLEFLERVEDEKSKGEICRVNGVISLCFGLFFFFFEKIDDGGGFLFQICRGMWQNCKLPTQIPLTSWRKPGICWLFNTRLTKTIRLRWNSEPRRFDVVYTQTKVRGSSHMISNIIRSQTRKSQIYRSDQIPRGQSCVLEPVSRKSRKLFGSEKPFVKIRPAYSVKLVF